MDAESSVLVAVLKDKQDLTFAQDAHWYRIPQKQAPQGVYADVIALFMSKKFFPNDPQAKGGIYYYAQRMGDELVSRRDLFPDQPHHKNANQLYYKVQLAPLQVKAPPIINEPIYIVSFIYTTWDRFQSATTIRDLYSPATLFVDRVFHALREDGYKAQRAWEYKAGARVRIICENGDVTAATTPIPASEGDFIYLNPSEYLENDEKSTRHYTAQIEEAVQRRGGPKMLDVPIELI